jgi:NAD(P)H dehydrogenase (quinone)
VSADRLIAIARDQQKAATLPDDITVRIADNDDPAALSSAVKGIDALLLISGNEFGKRMRQHTNVIDAALRQGVSHLAYTSAPHASTSEDFITREHRATESLVLESGLPCTILR